MPVLRTAGLEAQSYELYRFAVHVEPLADRIQRSSQVLAIPSV